MDDEAILSCITKTWIDKLRADPSQLCTSEQSVQNYHRLGIAMGYKDPICLCTLLNGFQF